ncbi:MAG: DUF3455 domain-containing protein [Usitatibacter sp.]
MNRNGFTALMLVVAAPAFAAAAPPAGISDALRPAANEEPAFVLNAIGVQVYACKTKPNDAHAYAWTFVQPDAALTEQGATVGKHYAGPTWESSDGSSVKGVVKERQDGGAGNVPWLRLEATPGPTQGRFSGVTSVLRVATRGGAEPKGGCDEFKVNQEMRVPYTADYYFYKKK